MSLDDIVFRVQRLCGGLGRRLESGLAPKRCVFCGVVTVEPERFLCGGCHADLPWVGLACPACAAPLPAGTPVGVVCAACQAHPSCLTAVVAPLEYEFPMDAAIKALKFRRKLHYVPAFTDMLLAAVPALPRDIDAVLPVPLHRSRKLFRGFNQAAELAGPVHRHLAVDILTNVVRTRATPYQSGLTASERRTNLNGAFRLRGKLTAKHILVVDDVITTGATTQNLAALLLKNGARKVSVLVLARAQ